MIPRATLSEAPRTSTARLDVAFFRELPFLAELVLGAPRVAELLLGALRNAAPLGGGRISGMDSFLERRALARLVWMLRSSESYRFLPS